LRPSCGPRARRRHGRARVTASSRVPRARESGRGRERRQWLTGDEPAVRGGGPGRRWAQRRFAAGGPVLGQCVGALARGGAGGPRGGLNLVRGGRGGGCSRGGGGASRRGCRRWAQGGGRGLEGGALGSWRREGAALPTQFLAGPTEKEREEKEETHRRGRRRRRFANWARGRGGEGWPKLVRGRRSSGRAFYRRAGARGAVELPDSGELPSAAINGAQRCRGDATARWYRRGRWSRGGGRSGAKLPCAAEWQRGGRRRRPEVTSARGRRTYDEAADPWGRLVRGSERVRGRVADGWGRLVSESG
jgi:hypothetical protein